MVLREIVPSVTSFACNAMCHLLMKPHVSREEGLSHVSHEREKMHGPTCKSLIYTKCHLALPSSTSIYIVDPLCTPAIPPSPLRPRRPPICLGKSSQPGLGSDRDRHSEMQNYRHAPAQSGERGPSRCRCPLPCSYETVERCDALDRAGYPVRRRPLQSRDRHPASRRSPRWAASTRTPRWRTTPGSPP